MPHKRDGSCYQNSRGYWCAEVPLGGGKRARTMRKREADARQWMTDVIARRDAGNRRPSNTEKLSTFLERWCDRKESEVAERTASYYRRNVGVISRYLGHIRLVDLRTKHVREMCAAIRAAGGRGHAPHHAKAVLHNALEAALEDELVTRNVAHFRLKKIGVKAREAVSPAVLTAILGASTGTRLEALWWLLVAYGLRRGELLGVAVADVDLAAGTLSIRQAVDEHGRIVALKTAGSHRTLPLTTEAARLLAARLVMLERERASRRWSEHGLLFPTSVGTPIRPRNLDKRFRALCDRAGVARSVTMHVIRHTAATDLEASGAPVKSTQRILGHASIQTTLGIYAHGRHEADVAAMQQLAAWRAPHNTPGTVAGNAAAGGALPHQNVVGRVGIEPTTIGLKDRCSTTELP